MQAVILAGGKGTRLKHLTTNIPKPMIPLLGKPLLEYQIALCKKYHISEVIILVNHLKDSIIEHFGNGEKFGIAISYYEEPEPLGTVGGVKAIEDRLTGDFLVLYGDVMLNMHLGRFAEFHKAHQSECTLALHPNDHPYDSDLVETDNQHRVTAFHPKPHEDGHYYRNLVNAGAYIFSKKVLELIEPGKKADFGKDIFPKIYAQINMYGYNTTEYLKDMGTPDRLEKVEGDVKSGLVEAKCYEHSQKAIFLDRDGVINPDKHLIYRPDEFELYPFTADAIKKINASPYLALVATNQSVVARNLCSEAELRIIHNKMDTLLGNERAKIDEVYYCPHHPDKGFPGENAAYKVVCDCRKPKPGMLHNGARDFNVDLSQSYFIGDSERDIIAGKAAGVTTIGLKTGKGLRDSKTEPDYFFLNLKEAIDFIIDDPHAALFEDLNTQFKAAQKQPFVISIAGNSRSGKSTLATYLTKRFSENNSVFKIELDDWILAKKDRPANASVFDNFQFHNLIPDLMQIMNGVEVTAIGYARHPERQPQPKTYQYKGEQVIIIEGIVAVSHEYLRNLADVKLFKTIDDQVLKRRIEEFYGWKGFTGKEIDALYLERKTTEYDVIAEHQEFADVVV